MVTGSENQNRYDSQCESISALVDGEQNDFDLRRILKDADNPEIREYWRRYHLIGASLRGELNPDNKMDISSQVWAALEDEPAHSGVSSSGRFKFLLSGIGKTAVAAGVMLAVLVGVQYAPVGTEPAEIVDATSDVVAPTQSSEVIPAGFTAPRLNARVVSTDPSAGNMTNYRQEPFVLPVSEVTRPANDPELQAYLNKLLLKHAEQSSQAGAIGVLPYARIISPEQDR